MGAGQVRMASFALMCALLGYSAKIASAQTTCTVARANDAFIGQTQLFGNKNVTDSIWHDQVPFFREYGPISKVTAYKAHFYDGLWHDPGELKGFQFWYGPNDQPPIYAYEAGDANLMGARKPHIPEDFVLVTNEVIIKVELQWDIISMRYVKFWTNFGRTWEWGFPDVPGAITATAFAPIKGAYLAAMRGFEGKPRPGISKKRYLIQIGLVWALPTCQRRSAPPSPPVEIQVSPEEQERRQALRMVTSMYALDAESVALLPQSMEAPNIVYDGVTIKNPPADAEVIVYTNATTMITVLGKKGVIPPQGPPGTTIYIPATDTIIPPPDAIPVANTTKPANVVEEDAVKPSSTTAAGAQTAKQPAAASSVPAEKPVATPAAPEPRTAAAVPVPEPAPVEAQPVQPPQRQNNLFGIFGFLFG